MLTDVAKNVLPEWAVNLVELRPDDENIDLICAGWATTCLALKDAREVLKGIEWMDAVGDDEDKRCPECGRWKWHGHWERCKLAKILGEGKG